MHYYHRPVPLRHLHMFERPLMPVHALTIIAIAAKPPKPIDYKYLIKQ